jgi:NADH-quinone oxidoreductase subunit E
MSRSEILNKYKPDKSNLLLILHELQNSNPNNYISSEDIIEVTKYLKLTYSSVYGVVTYYSMFSRKPRGKHIIRVCNSPVCKMMDSADIIVELKAILSINEGETTPDGLFSIETTECLGKCDESPAMIINEKFYGDISSGKIAGIIDLYKSENQ